MLPINIYLLLEIPYSFCIYSIVRFCANILEMLDYLFDKKLLNHDSNSVQSPKINDLILRPLLKSDYSKGKKNTHSQLRCS